METYALLQHYWWFIISLLGGILVFLLFIQGGQTLIYTITSNDTQKSMVINSLGHKWELTFTTLVRFVSAFLFHQFRRCFLCLDGYSLFLCYPGCSL